MTAEQIPVPTADEMIAKYGDQAYHTALIMQVEALCGRDRARCQAFAEMCLELLRRGYHKRGKAGA